MICELFEIENRERGIKRQRERENRRKERQTQKDSVARLILRRFLLL